MKKICLSLIILFMFCGAAAAHIVYTTENGNVGLISVSSTENFELSAKQYEGNPNSVIATYWENNTSNGDGNSKLILITPLDEGNTTASGDTAVRFSSVAALGAPIDNANNPIVLRDSYGVPVLCGTNNGGSFYIATGATVREYLTSNFNRRNIFTYQSSDLAPNPEIKAVLRNDNRVYALVALNNGVSEDIFVDLYGTLTGTSYTVTNLKNSRTMNYINNSVIIAGAKDGVYKLSGSTATSLVPSDFPVVAIHGDTGSGFYYLAHDEANNQVLLYHYTSENTPSAFKTIEGSAAAFVKDPSFNILGVLIGKEILLLNMDDDKILKEYGTSELGDNPISITESSTTGHSNDKSGGCVVGGGSLIMMFILLAALKNKRRLA